MAVSKWMRDRIETLLTIYVGHQHGHRDVAGFIGKSHWDAAVNNVGHGTGVDRSNSESIFQIRHLNDVHALYGLAKMLLGRLDACRDCAKHQVQEITGPFEPLPGIRPYSRAEVARGVVYSVSEVCRSCEGRGYVFRDGKIKQRYAVALYASREYRGQSYGEIALLVCMPGRQYETALQAGREEVAELLELRDAFQKAERGEAEAVV